MKNIQIKVTKSKVKSVKFNHQIRKNKFKKV